MNSLPKPEVAATAVFVADGKPDHTARVLVDEVGIGISIDFGDGEGPQIANFPASAGRLQLAEALQFAADEISKTVPGRLTPFQRGWIGLSADLHGVAKSKRVWDTPERGNGITLSGALSAVAAATQEVAIEQQTRSDEGVRELTAMVADAVECLMDFAYANGLPVAAKIQNDIDAVNKIAS